MLRFIFFLLIAIFIVRLINSSFKKTTQTKRDIDVQQPDNTKTKKVKKDVGEYVDYEEIK